MCFLWLTDLQPVSLWVKLYKTPEALEHSKIIRLSLHINVRQRIWMLHLCVCVKLIFWTPSRVFDYVNALFIFLFLLRSERKHFMELHWRILKYVCHLSQDSVIFSCFGFLVYIFGLLVYICWVFYLKLKHLCSNFGIPVLIYFGLAYREFEFRYYLVLICVTLCFGSGLFLVISLRFLFESCSVSFQCLCLGPAVFFCQLCVSYSLIFSFICPAG